MYMSTLHVTSLVMQHCSASRYKIVGFHPRWYQKAVSMLRYSNRTHLHQRRVFSMVTAQRRAMLAPPAVT